MSALTDPWHFPRPDLAQSYLRSFDLGLTVGTRLILHVVAWGKSEFLKHDLLSRSHARRLLGSLHQPLGFPQTIQGKRWRQPSCWATQTQGTGQVLDGPQRPDSQNSKGGGKLPLGVEGSIELDLAEKGEGGGPRNPSCIAVG